MADEVNDMALVGRRDGRIFGYGRQLSFAGPQALKGIFGSGHYGTVKAHCDRWQAFVKWCRSERGPVSMMRGRLIGRYWRTMRRSCATWLGAATLLSVPHKTAYPALTGPWRRFAVISA